MKEQKLLEEVIANPDDDEPRLLYADWLEERGDPRAQFIRVQCEQHNTSPTAARWFELEGRQLRLLQQHGHKWRRALPKLPGAAWGIVDDPPFCQRTSVAYRRIFERGFAEAVTFKNAADFTKQMPELRKFAPVRQARITKLTRATVSDFAANPLLHELTGLFLLDVNIGLEGLEQIFARSEFPHLRRVDVVGSGMHRPTKMPVDEWGKRLLQWQGLLGVTDFDCGVNMIAHGDVLFRFLQHMPNLEHFRRPSLGHQLAGSFIRHACAKQMTTLNYYFKNVPPQLAKYAASSRNLKRVHTLFVLDGWKSEPEYQPPEIFFDSLRLPQLRRLAVLPRAFLSGAALSKPVWNRLYALQANPNLLNGENLAAIRGGKSLSQLRILDLSIEKTNEAFANLILELENLSNLQLLALKHGKLKKSTQNALQERFGSASVRQSKDITVYAKG